MVSAYLLIDNFIAKIQGQTTIGFVVQYFLLDTLDQTTEKKVVQE